MRIGIVTDSYFPSVGGTEISIWNYTKSLERMGHEVFVFCPDQGKSNPKKKRSSTVRLPSIKHIYTDHPLMFVYPGITSKFRKYNLDVIHSQTPITAPYIAEHIARKLSIPHVHTMHTLVPEQVKRWRTGYGRMLILYIFQSLIIKSFKKPKNYLLQDEKTTLAYKVRLCWIYMLRLVQMPDRVIFPSRHVKELFEGRGFTNKAHILPTFSDMFLKGSENVARRESGKKPLQIIHVGRLDAEKRPQVIIDAVNLIPDHVSWRLLMVGDGTERKKLEQLVKKYGLTDRVHFTGKLKQRSIKQKLLESDIFVMSSFRFDTQGIVLLEACDAHLPIVYCDDNLSVGVEPANSVLTKPYAWDMSRGIAKLLQDDDLREQLSYGSSLVARKYRPQKLTAYLIGIYLEAINENEDK